MIRLGLKSRYKALIFIKDLIIKNGKDIKGKDYDHKDKKFKSVKANRGNDGKGTKKEN